MIRWRSSGHPWYWALATKFRVSPKLMLLSLAIAITTGSVMSPDRKPAEPAHCCSTAGWKLRLSRLPCTFSFLHSSVSVSHLSFSGFISGLIFQTRVTSTTIRSCPAINKMYFPVKCSLAIILILAAANIIVSLYSGNFLVPLPLIALCAAVPVIVSGTRQGETAEKHRLVYACLFCRNVRADGECLADRFFPVIC